VRHKSRVPALNFHAALITHAHNDVGKRQDAILRTAVSHLLSRFLWLVSTDLAGPVVHSIFLGF